MKSQEKSPAPLWVRAVIGFFLYAIALPVGDGLFVRARYGTDAYHKGLRVTWHNPPMLSNGVKLSIPEEILEVAFIAAVLVAMGLPSFSFAGWVFRRFLRPESATNGDGQMYFYSSSNPITVYEDNKPNIRFQKGLVRAHSEQQARDYLKAAGIGTASIRPATEVEIGSGKLQILNPIQEGPPEQAGVTEMGVWRAGAPDNYVVPSPSGKCKTRLNGVRVKGTLNLAKKGAQSCVLFTYGEGGAGRSLEIPFEEIARVDVSRFPLAKLWIDTTTQGQFVFSGDVRKIGSVFQYVLSTEKGAGSI